METPPSNNHRLCRLNLQVGPDSLHAVSTSTVADSSLVYKRLPLDPAAPLHKALEEVIYANDSLLADYGSTNILFDTDSYTLVPADCQADSDDIASVTQIGRDGDTELSVITDAEAAGVRVVWTIAARTQQFLSRTFRNAPMCHTMTVLLKYFHKQAQAGNRAKVYLHLTDSTSRRLDIAAFDSSGHLRMATGKKWENDTDVLYYALSCAQMAGFDAERDELLLCGDSNLRMNVTQLLSRYVRNVMPLIFPSAALRAGFDAFKAPFPSIIQPLCE